MMTRRRLGALFFGVLGGALPLWRAPAEAQWKKYGPGERYQALQNYERHRELPKQQRKEIERQYQRFQQMPDEERERIRKNYQRFQQMPPAQRSEIEKRSRKNPPRDGGH
jgi:hypothetical protein